jgi:hypothetical protein
MEGFSITEKQMPQMRLMSTGWLTNMSVSKPMVLLCLLSRFMDVALPTMMQRLFEFIQRVLCIGF